MAKAKSKPAEGLGTADPLPTQQPPVAPAAPAECRAAVIDLFKALECVGRLAGRPFGYDLTVRGKCDGLPVECSASNTALLTATIKPPSGPVEWEFATAADVAERFVALCSDPDGWSDPALDVIDTADDQYDWLRDIAARLKDDARRTDSDWAMVPQLFESLAYDLADARRTVAGLSRVVRSQRELIAGRKAGAA